MNQSIIASSSKTQTIAFIGAGKLGSSLVQGLLRANDEFKNHIIIADKFQQLITECNYSNNKEAVQQADIIILAVQPKQVTEVLEEIAPVLTSDKILISVVLGLSIETIKKTIQQNTMVVRAMPNIAAATQNALTCLSFEQDANANDKKAIQTLFEQLGTVIEINEGLMDAATVMTGSGIAFALKFMRAMMQGGISIGFDAASSLLLARAVTASAVSILKESKLHPDMLIDKVTTPNGCTIAGLNRMESVGLSTSVVQGIVAAHERIVGVR